ncbi:uncharacterized protein G2W53_023899 [Senna tora]|uniref:Uncharacterized protein n=1 Tax=Senna tora TaxID=362788 RepID=A0A834TJ53_9FABA|nr:uncharacterized protein G2W53_023899 [Senna tora]
MFDDEKHGGGEAAKTVRILTATASFFQPKSLSITPSLCFSKPRSDSNWDLRVENDLRKKMKILRVETLFEEEEEEVWGLPWRRKREAERRRVGVKNARGIPVFLHYFP